MSTWKELQAQGIKRCCVYFKDGTRCRRRAVNDDSWCAKHSPIMAEHTAAAIKAIKQQKEEVTPDDDCSARRPAGRFERQSLPKMELVILWT